jgi:hypothetical protein
MLSACLLILYWTLIAIHLIRKEKHCWTREARKPSQARRETFGHYSKYYYHAKEVWNIYLSHTYYILYMHIYLSESCGLISRDLTAWKIQVKLQRFERRPFIGKSVIIVTTYTGTHCSTYIYHFFCVGVVYSGEYDACDVTLSVYPHRARVRVRDPIYTQSNITSIIYFISRKIIVLKLRC